MDGHNLESALVLVGHRAIIMHVFLFLAQAAEKDPHVVRATMVNQMVVTIRRWTD